MNDFHEVTSKTGRLRGEKRFESEMILRAAVH